MVNENDPDSEEIRVAGKSVVRVDQGTVLSGKVFAGMMKN